MSKRLSPEQPLELVSRARELLCAATPEALDQAADLLEQARQALTVDVAGWLTMRGELRRMHLLLAHAAGFYRGWTRIKSLLVGGYNSQGEAAPQTPQGRVSVEG